VVPIPTYSPSRFFSPVPTSSFATTSFSFIVQASSDPSLIAIALLSTANAKHCFDVSTPYIKDLFGRNKK